MKNRELYDSLYDLIRHIQDRNATIANAISHIQGSIDILIREQNVLRNAIKELKNVNDGR